MQEIVASPATQPCFRTRNLHPEFTHALPDSQNKLCDSVCSNVRRWICSNGTSFTTNVQAGSRQM
eukprot:4311966-Amphidinium_carterae.2